ncbi:MAG: protein kinase [Burkholderiales bacterium]
MAMDAATLQRLSSLLDRAFELDPAAREDWLDGLDEDDAPLAPRLRELLARTAAQRTTGMLGSPPAFTVVDADDAAPAGLAAGDLIGPYRLERLLGRGGMGEVWLAERDDGTVKRKVALKLPHLSWSPAFAERFARERDFLASLEHPHIARLYDAGVDRHGRPFMALEYVEGKPIDVFCREGALAVDARLRLILQVAGAVAFAHGRLVLHRDLKPGNMLVTADGNVRLLDFGIAKMMEGDAAHETALTRVGGRALTLDYASPEQIRGEPLGTASDVYSLGVVAFELLAGARPYRLKRGSAAELEDAIVDDDAPLASSIAEHDAVRKRLKGDLDAILNKALKKHATERYATVDAFAQDLRWHLAGQRVLARPDTLLYRASRFAQRHRVPLAVGAIAIAAFGLAIGLGATAIVILALLVGLGAAVWQARKARAQARKAEQESRRAQAVQRFLVDLFRVNSSRQKNPAKARATTARELLDLGAERLATTLVDAPEARVEVMGTLGQMYYELELEDEAAEIDAQRVDLLRSMLGDRDVRLAEALITLAGSLHATGQRERILPALEEAQRILDAAGDHRSPQRGELLLRLSQRHYNLDLSKALAYGEEAVAILRDQPEIDHDLLSTALIIAARARSQLGDYADAERLYRSAIEHVLLTPDTPHFDLMQARSSLAEVLMQRQQFDAAIALAREAVDEGAAALGADSPGVIACRSRLASILHSLGHRTEAREGLRRSLDDVLRVKGHDDTMYTPIARVELARGLLADGRIAEAGALADAVEAVYAQHYAESPVRANALRLQAMVLVEYGRADEARVLVQEADRILQASPLRPWRFNRLVLDAARVELASGKPDAALRALQRYAPWPESETPPPSPDVVERETMTARAHLALGDASAARHHAQAAVDAAAKVASRGRQPGLEADAALVHGMTLLAQGEADAGRASVARALAIRREFDDPASPRIVEADALLAQSSPGAVTS